MTIDQVIYFVNHVADINGMTPKRRFFQGLILVGIPVCIAMLHIITLPKLFRGNVKVLVCLYVSMYLFSTLAPIMICYYSLNYIQSYQNIPYMIVLYLFFAVLYGIGIEEYYPKYKYKTDEDYLRATKFPDGSKIDMQWPKKNRLLALAVYLNINSLLLLICFILFMMWLIIGISIFYAKVVMLVGGPMLMFHMLALRWLNRCPNCNRPIFNPKYDQSYLANIYFYKTAFDVLFKKKCECIVCNAHYNI